MNWQIKKPEELSNEDYQQLPEVSGSGLSTIYNQSPAHFKYQQKPSTPALQFGIAAHAMLLEPELFDAEFVRDIDEEQYPDALVTTKDMQAWLKERGQKVSGSKPELIERIHAVEPDTHIMEVLKQQHAESAGDKTIMKPADYDACISMRETIMQDETMAAMLKGGYSEYSLIGELNSVGVKTRPDLITSAGGLVQYKTAQSCHPVEFGRKVDNYGYLLKAALEWECFTACYGSEPQYYVWLVQEKSEPYIWKPYNLTPEALAIGRVQLETALRIYAGCKDSGQWPGYGNEIENIQLPEWLKRQYGIN